VQLLEDDKPIPGKLTVELINQVLTRGQRSSETNLSLVADDGSFLSVSLGTDSDPQLITSDHPRGAVSVCVSPLTMDSLSRLFMAFHQQQPDWQNIVKWNHSSEATIAAAKEQGKRFWRRLLRLYLMLIPIVTGVIFLTTDGDIGRTVIYGWMMIGIAIWFRAMVYMVPYWDAARDYTARRVGVELIDGSDPTSDDIPLWRILGEATVGQRFQVTLYIFAYSFIGLLYCVLVPGLALALPLYFLGEAFPI